MELLAEKYWGSFGPAAMPRLTETVFDVDCHEETMPRVRNLGRNSFLLTQIPSNANYVLGIDSQDVTSTVDICSRKVQQVPQQLKLVHIFSRILVDDAGEGITMEMRTDALRFLSKFPAEIAMPVVELGTAEITFEWRYQDKAATASVEGDGLVGYALKKNGRFMPGMGPEELSAAEVPSDLLAYLNDFPIG